MNENKVVVLLSTYNGEKYIKEQLDSILNQIYKNIKIIVRDDGSTDNTVQILKEYNNDGKIILYIGNNIGHVKSYYWLLENSEKADYYSFADQDDIWFNYKIFNAVNALNYTGNEKPSLYFSDFDYCNKDLIFISHKKPLKLKINFYSVLLNNINWGFTSVINNKLRDMFLLMPSHENIPHDYLILFLGYFFGNIIYDKYRCAKHRIHDNNVSMSYFNFFKHQIWRIKNILLSDDLNFKKRWISFLNIYNYILTEEIKNEFKIYINVNNYFYYYIKKIFKNKRYRDELFDEIAIRFIFLIGRI